MLSAITILNGCCWIKARFTDEEMKWLNVYNVGDTLIFRSQHSELDTTYIIAKRIWHIDCNPFLSYEGLMRPIIGHIYYGRSPDDEIDSINSIIRLYKYSDRTSLYIEYLSRSAVFLDMEEEVVCDIKKGKVYEFDTSSQRARPENPKTIFWHEDSGIIKYITHEGVEWKRINLDFEVE